MTRDVAGDYSARRLHLDSAMAEWASHYHDRGNSGFLEAAGDVSDGHVTVRSDRYEQRGVHFVLFEQRDPFRNRLFSQVDLGSESHE